MTTEQEPDLLADEALAAWEPGPFVGTGWDEQHTCPSCGTDFRTNRPGGQIWCPRCQQQLVVQGEDRGQESRSGVI